MFCSKSCEIYLSENIEDYCVVCSFLDNDGNNTMVEMVKYFLTYKNVYRFQCLFYNP